jgi:hypothetical protein
VSASSNRWAWVWPAVIGAAVTVLVLVALRLVLDDDAAADTDSLPRSPASPASSGSAAEPSSPTEPSPTWTREDARSRLHLTSTGLDMVGFGDSQLDVVRTLTDVLGAPDEDDDLPCDGHPEDQMHWVRWADLSVVFDAGTFIGYMEGVHVPPGSPPVDVGTAKGLSPGDSFERAVEIYGELQLHHQPMPGPGESDLFRFEDPPGQGDMFGVVEGTEETGQTVITIYAGDLC